jgi:hypothetical protein
MAQPSVVKSPILISTAEADTMFKTHRTPRPVTALYTPRVPGLGAVGTERRPNSPSAHQSYTTCSQASEGQSTQAPGGISDADRVGTGFPLASSQEKQRMAGPDSAMETLALGLAEGFYPKPEVHWLVETPLPGTDCIWNSAV